VRIDLHSHTTASDGTDTPAELVAKAHAADLDVLAITDHDSVDGWAEAIAAKPPGLTLVPGVEFSAVHHGESGRRTSLHLLAYLLDGSNAALQKEWARLRAQRLTRGEAIVDLLIGADYPITWEQVRDLADGGTVGRPHIARALVASGVVPDVDSAFAELLNPRTGFHVRKVDTDVFEAIRLVREAGGLPVFAHPFARRRGPVVDEEVVVAMATAGLVGIEVDHPDHEPEDRALAARLAAQLDLVPTGSSDYHGSSKTTRLGARLTSAESWERLLAHPAALEPIT
jgi:predicted metal-dependent phosphoesterase TrpH